MPGLGFDPNGYYNNEYIDNQETLNLTASPYKNAKRVVLVDSSGNVVSLNLSGYYVNDTDQSSSTRYYGFSNASGAWYILQEIIGTTNSYRYAAGPSAYTTAWTGRAGLTYGYYDVVF